MRIFLLSLLLFAFANILSAAGSVKPSTLFPYQYNSDVEMDPLEGPFTNDTIVRYNNANTHYIDSGLSYWTNTDQCKGVFIRHKQGINAPIFDIYAGFTVELKLAASAEQNCNDNYAKWGLMIETADNGLRLDFRAHHDRLLINGISINDIAGKPFDAYEFNTIRAAYSPGATEYQIWVNRVFIGNFGHILSSPVNRFYFGDLGSAQEGMIILDYIRIDDSGSYKPQILINIEHTGADTVIKESGDNGQDQYMIIPLEQPSAPFTVICTPDSEQVSINDCPGGDSYQAHFYPSEQGQLPEPQVISVSAVYDGIRQIQRQAKITHTTTSTDSELCEIPIDDLVLTIEADQWCGQNATIYNTADINLDCQVNIKDISIIASQWLICSDPADPSCLSNQVQAEKENIFGTIYNFDGDFSFNSYNPDTSELGINMIIDTLAGTSVGAITYSIASGSDIMNYPTNVASLWGWRTTSQEDNPNIAARVAKARACQSQEMDAVRIAGERTKLNGMMFFPSLRMNDYHFVSDPFNSFLTGEFWIENHQSLTIAASGGSSPITGKPDCVNLLDFTYPQVRQYRLDTINEVIDKNADIIDGFELDFTRSFVFFPKNTAQERAYLLTGLVSQVKEKLELLEETNNRDYYLIARTPPTIDKCEFAGIDIEQWIADDIVDVIVPAELMTTWFELPTDEFAQLIDYYGSNCKVFAGMYPRVGWNWQFSASPSSASYSSAPAIAINQELTRAAIANFYNRRSDGIYCYNFGLPRTEIDFRRLKDFASAKAIIGENKVFTVTKSFWLDYEDSFLPPKQIPAQIVISNPLSFKIEIGEAINPLTARNALDYCGIRIGFRQINPQETMLIKINGTELFDGQLAANLIEVTNPDFDGGNYSPVATAFWQQEITDTNILKQGTNDLEITFANLISQDALITDIDIAVIYAPKTTGVLYEQD